LAPEIENGGIEMFDQLVESNSAEADFKPRRKFFLVSSVVVGILFATAVVASIYAADFDLGTDNFDLAELLTPIAETEPANQPEPPRNQNRDQQNTSDETTRRVLMASTSDPTRVPTTTSTAVNPYISIPEGKFDIGKRDTNAAPPDSGIPDGDGPGSSSSSARSTGEDEDIDRTPPPAPAKKIEAPKRPVSIGVANGKAIDLPKPPYPPAAVAVKAQGAVNVQVTIDEKGKVISAQAASGHPLLRKAAENAAWRARFTPTLLSNVPVKVTGVIIYNFTR
jgi:protein TonB